MTRRRLAAVLLAVVVVPAAVVGISALQDDDHQVQAAAPAAAEPAPSTTGPTTPPTTLPALLVPEPAPDDPWAPTPDIVIGHIEIPALGIDTDLHQGVTLTAINRGPSHWPGTPEPGGLGNMVIAGHRTTWSKPFADLDQLQPGQQVIFTTPAGRFVYEVRGTMVVPAENIGLISQSYAHTATLFACHPRGQATHRIVAKLRLLDDTGRPVDADDDLPSMDVGLRDTDITAVVAQR
jgi:sortase A